MEILFADTYYDSEEWEEGKFAKEIVNNLRDFDSQVTAIDTDIGHGADLPGALPLVDPPKSSITWDAIRTASQQRASRNAGHSGGSGAF